jgi:hypothetical protein
MAAPSVGAAEPANMRAAKASSTEPANMRATEVSAAEPTDMGATETAKMSPARVTTSTVPAVTSQNGGSEAYSRAECERCGEYFDGSGEHGMHSHA